MRAFWKQISTFQVILLGFLAVILLGSLLLMLPVSASAGTVTSFPNALFTATSAVCVTGLIVQDTATYWSEFGQAVILLLIQIGGLGVISAASAISSSPADASACANGAPFKRRFPPRRSAV